MWRDLYEALRASEQPSVGLRPDLAHELRERFERFERELAGHAGRLRDQPWYLRVGGSGTGFRTLLLHGLRESREWMFTHRTELWVGAAGVVVQQVGPPNPRSLEAIERVRGRPFDGLLYPLRSSSLLGPEPRRVQRRDDPQLRPRIALITFCDRLPGFLAAEQRLSPQARDQPFGVLRGEDAPLATVLAELVHRSCAALEASAPYRTADARAIGESLRQIAHGLDRWQLQSGVELDGAFLVAAPPQQPPAHIRALFSEGLVARRHEVFCPWDDRATS